MARVSYGKGPYSRVRALAPIFSGDLSLVPNVNFAGGLTPTVVLAGDIDVHVNLIMLQGDLAPQIDLGGSLSLVVSLGSLIGSFGFTVVLGPSEMISGPLWADSEPCPSAPWAPSEPCPPSLWTPIGPCEPVVWKKSELCNG